MSRLPQTPGSAKELIGRWESLNASPATPPRRAIPKSSPLEKKEKSPLRQSINKFISVLKGSSPKAHRRNQPVYSPQREVRNDSLDVPSEDPPSSVQTTQQESEETVPLSGKVLFLHSDKPQDDKNWISTTAELRGQDSVRLHWENERGLSVNHTIHLVECSDVCSLSAEEVLTQAKHFPESDVIETRAFQIVFDNNRRETFAVGSSFERARWVSAIWDAILACPEMLARADVSRSTSKGEHAERDLPPLPPLSTTPPVFPPSPSTAPPTRPASGASTIDSRCKSPSISKLSTRSLVKSRLAHLNTEAPPFPSPYSSEIFSSSRSARGESGHLDYPQIIDPGRFASRRSTSSDDDSIIACYDVVNPVRNQTCSEPNIEKLTSAAARGGTSQASASEATLFSLPEEIIRLNLNAAADCQLLKDTTSVISSQLQSLHHSVHSALSRQESDSLGPTLGNIDQNVQSVEMKTDASQRLLREFGANIQTLGQQLSSLQNDSKLSGSSNVPPSERDSEILHSIAMVKDQITALAQNVLDLKATSENNASCTTTLSNIPPPPPPAMDGHLGKTTDDNQITEILDQVRAQSKSQDSLSQQYGDCLRYLNELNGWLGGFVTDNTSKIEGMSSAVQRLLLELGAGQDSTGEFTPQGNVLADIRLFLAEAKEKGQSSRELQDSVETLRSALQNAASSTFSVESVAEMMERQRLGQEGMMRAFAAQLSDEIRGERLRFVDAMKEATAINVQTHVENFKKELNREVMMMVAEAGRLQKEKQALELQRETRATKDLIAFYARQGQPGEPSMIARPIPVPRPQQMTGPPADITQCPHNLR